MDCHGRPSTYYSYVVPNMWIKPGLQTQLVLISCLIVTLTFTTAHDGSHLIHYDFTLIRPKGSRLDSPSPINLNPQMQSTPVGSFFCFGAFQINNWNFCGVGNPKCRYKDRITQAWSWEVRGGSFVAARLEKSNT